MEKTAGRAAMADISGKAATDREAVAEGFVSLSAGAWDLVVAGSVPKGDVLGVSRVAGIMAAKATPRILPLCHPIPLAAVSVEFSLPSRGEIRIEARARTVAPTGVEMEALTAVSAAALCVYDMLKPVDRGIVIERIRLLRKSGGKSGVYAAPRRESAARSPAASRSASARSRGGRAVPPKRSR